MALPKNRTDLRDFFNREEFITDTCQQINKDMLGLLSGTLDFKIDMERSVLDQLSRQLSLVLNNLSPRDLQQFAYRVDLKQGDYVKALQQEDEFQQLAFIVIRREAQKVYLRALYG